MNMFGNMPTVRSIYPSFLERLILCALSAGLPALAAVLEGVNASYYSGYLLLTILLNVVVGSLLDGRVVGFGSGFLLLVLGSGRSWLGSEI